MTDQKRLEQALTSNQLGKVFRHLADEYADQGASSNEATWAKIEAAAPGLRVAPSRGAGRSRAFYLGLAAAAAISLAAFGFHGLYGSSLDLPLISYSVDGIASSWGEGTEGELIASEGRPVVVKFSDETRVTLKPYSTLRLDADEGGKIVVARLSQGEAEFESGGLGGSDQESVGTEQKQGVRTRFVLRAGVYTLKPLGAAFTFAYMPHEARLEVQSRRGTFVVEAEDGRKYNVHPGGHLSLPEGRVPEQSDAQKLADREELTGSAEVGGQEDSKVEGSPGARSSSAEKSFKVLASEGKFTEIVAIAKKRGIGQVLATSSASDLHELGQAARYAGDLALASQIWTHMTQRFSGAPAQSAKFFLGRLAEQQGNSALALSHYTGYLEASGGGVYTAEALGRKLSIVHQSHGAQKARPIAEEYLRRFPQGAYAKTARGLVGGE